MVLLRVDDLVWGPGEASSAFDVDKTCTLTRLQLALIVLFVPETYHPVLLRNKARMLRKETGDANWIAPIEKLSRSIPKTVLWSCIRPFQLLFFEPMVGRSRWTGILIGGLMLCLVPQPLCSQCHSARDTVL